MKTVDYACENRPTPCVGGVGQVLVLAAETACRERRSGALTRLEQSPVLEEGVAIGHAGDVISDRASARGGSVCGFRAQRWSRYSGGMRLTSLKNASNSWCTT